MTYEVGMRNRVWGFAHEHKEDSCFDCQTDRQVIQKMPTGLLLGELIRRDLIPVSVDVDRIVEVEVMRD